MIIEGKEEAPANIGDVRQQFVLPKNLFFPFLF